MAKSWACRFLTPVLLWKAAVWNLTAWHSFTTIHCLLNKNRNPHLSQKEIERYLIEFYGVDNILWLADGIVGDDTDGHIDDLTRFVNEDTVVTVVEENEADENYELLQENLKTAAKMRLENGKQINIVELPAPKL